MKQYPPHLSQADLRSVVLLLLTVAISLSFLLSLAAGGHGGAGPLVQPLEAPAGFGL
jgi:hypothetical protein